MKYLVFILSVCWSSSCFSQEIDLREIVTKLLEHKGVQAYLKINESPAIPIRIFDMSDVLADTTIFIQKKVVIVTSKPTGLINLNMGYFKEVFLSAKFEEIDENTSLIEGAFISYGCQPLSLKSFSIVYKEENSEIELECCGDASW